MDSFGMKKKEESDALEMKSIIRKYGKGPGAMGKPSSSKKKSSKCKSRKFGRRDGRKERALVNDPSK